MGNKRIPKKRKIGGIGLPMILTGFFLVFVFSFGMKEKEVIAAQVEHSELILPGPDVLLRLDVDKAGMKEKKNGEETNNLFIQAERDRLVIGKEYVFYAVGYPKTEEKVPVVWESSNSFVASVDENGVVTPRWEGKAVITARASDGSDVFASKTIQVIEGKVVVLDPGHGGKDSGAVSSKYHLVERNMNLDIAMACKEELEQYDGITVYMTRTTNGEYPDLSTRPAIAAQKEADLFVSFHINDGSFFSSGAEVYQSVKTSCQVPELARGILKNLSSLGMKNRGIKMRRGKNGQDYYAVIRGSVSYDIPGIIIEHGFINNGSDASKMDSLMEREMFGKADARAIASYFGLSLSK